VHSAQRLRLSTSSDPCVDHALDGLIIGRIALDVVRPIIAPSYGIWAINNLSASYGMFFAIAATVILIDIAIFAWVKRKWGKIKL
jgi:hypothetical protein